MTNRKSVTEQQGAERLLQALNEPDELSCAEARELIPALVEAEQAGEDVDANPQFAALLRHLDHCPECPELYAQLAEDLEALTGADAVLPPVPLTAPDFFTPARQSKNIILRLLRGLKRGFELDLAIPSLTPAGALLSGGERASLFSDRLPELAGNPQVIVALESEPDAPKLLVAVREGGALTRWRVQLQIGDQVYTAHTNERGIAQFSGFSIAQLQRADRLSVICTEERTGQP